MEGIALHKVQLLPLQGSLLCFMVQVLRGRKSGVQDVAIKRLLEQDVLHMRLFEKASCARSSIVLPPPKYLAPAAVALEAFSTPFPRNPIDGSSLN